MLPFSAPKIFSAKVLPFMDYGFWGLNFGEKAISKGRKNL
jgi:hypothetical protein